MADNLYFCSMLERKRHTKMKPLFRRLLGGVAIAAALYSCASVGRIEGGPYDETPPRFISGTPTPGALHHNKNKAVDFICSKYCWDGVVEKTLEVYRE